MLNAAGAQNLWKAGTGMKTMGKELAGLTTAKKPLVRRLRKKKVGENFRTRQKAVIVGTCWNAVIRAECHRPKKIWDLRECGNRETSYIPTFSAIFYFFAFFAKYYFAFFTKCYFATSTKSTLLFSAQKYYFAFPAKFCFAKLAKSTLLLAGQSVTLHFLQNLTLQALQNLIL